MKHHSNMQKFLAGSATAALVASALVPAAAAEEAAAKASFSDVPASSSHFDNINKAVDYKLLNGYPDNTFKPDKKLTRSDVVKTLSRYLVQKHGDGDIENIDLSDVEAFNDVPEDYQDGELYQASLVVKKYKVFNGANGNLNPTDLITRQAMAKVLVNAFNLELQDDKESKVTDNDMADEEFRGFIDILSENEVTAVTNFRPKENTSRAQFASFLVRGYEKVTDGEMLESGIAGFINDGEKPVVGATVSIGDEMVKTNDQGYYELKNIASGKREVTITADGFETMTTKDVTVEEESLTSFSTDISDSKINTDNIVVSGTIVDSETGAAIEDAEVSLEMFNEETEAWEEVASLQTTAAGAYSIDQTSASNGLQLGAEYRQVVSIDGYKMFEQMITLDDQEVTNALEGIQLEAIAEMNVMGTVTNSKGEKVNGASVMISDSEGNEVTTATTDAEGMYKVEDLQLVDGTYNVVVDDTTSAVSYTEFDVVEGEDATHDVQLQEGNTITATIGTESLGDVFGKDNTIADEADYTLELMSGNTVIKSSTFKGVSVKTTKH